MRKRKFHPNSLAVLLKMAKERKGKHREPFSKEWKENLSKAHMGIAVTKGIKRPQQSGRNHWAWIEDKSKLKRYGDDKTDRRSPAHRYWSRQVKNRDGWKCKIANGNCSGRVESHHILGWKEYPELRYEINNGITLCHAHHPRKRAEEKRLSPYFQSLVSVSNKQF